MENFLDKKFKNVSNDNMLGYLKFMGANYFSRRIALAMRPIWWITRNDDGTYTVRVESVVITIVVTFELNKDFEEKRSDGVICRTKFFMEGQNLIQIQHEIVTGKTYRHEKQIQGDTLISTTTAEGWDEKFVGVFELVK